MSSAAATATASGPVLESRRTAAPSSPAGDDGAGSPRFLLYSHDALGLGHVRRNLVIAAAFVERSPGASVLLATSAEHADSLGVPERVDLMQLPAVRKVDNGHYTPRRLPISGSDLTALREGILAATVESYKPSVLLASGEELALVDFDGLCRVPAALDLATYAAQVVLGDEPALERSERVLSALLAAYGPRPPAVRWYLATCILRRAARPFRYFEPDSPERVGGMLTAAEAVS